MTLFTDATVSPPPHGLLKSSEERAFYRAEYADAVIVPLALFPRAPADRPTPPSLSL